MKLSVAILAKNEAANLPEALESVKWADEIIVGVDATSTDETEAIAKESGCKVLTVDLSKGFATAKNQLIDAAKMNWILVLDADERVTAKLRDEIVHTIETTTESGFWVPCHNNLLGRFMDHGGWYPDKKLRLVMNGRARYIDREIHEDMQVEGSVGSLINPLQHYTHRTIKEILRRIDQYSDLDAKIIVGVLPKRIRARTLLRPALREFWRRYIKLRGYKDGIVGFIEAALQGVYVFVGYVKAWELRKK